MNSRKGNNLNDKKINKLDSIIKKRDLTTKCIDLPCAIKHNITLLNTPIKSLDDYTPKNTL